MTVTHSLGTAGHTAQMGRGGAHRTRLYVVTRLLNRKWHHAGWMLNHSPLSLEETLDDPRFTSWLFNRAGNAAMAAAQEFTAQPREDQQVLALLVRCYRLDRRTPRWAVNFWR